MSTTMFTGDRPFVLTIAGFDPSAGAGVLSDIKTIEALQGYGVAVNTANTVQNDVQFRACHWIPENRILQQLEVLLERYPITVVKIGIIENLQVLDRVLDELLTRNKALKIIWDPVLRSSSGFSFQEPGEFQENLTSILDRIFLLTPNLDEIKTFLPDHSPEETIQKISSRTNLYLKGGHSTEAVGLDHLFTTEGEVLAFEPMRTGCSEKHGSGCILSSALATSLALGYPLAEALRKAKDYTEKVLTSNETLLGYHES